MAHKLAESCRHGSILKQICEYFENVGHVNSVDGLQRGRSLVARGRAQCVFPLWQPNTLTWVSRHGLKCTTKSVLQDHRPFVLDHGVVRSLVALDTSGHTGVVTMETRVL